MGGDLANVAHGHRRLSLRALLVLMVFIAIAMAVARPIAREGFRNFERRVRITLNQRDYSRHLDVDRACLVARGFASAIRSGQFDEAYQLTTMSYRRRTPLSQFKVDLGPSPLRLAPHDLVFGFIQFSDTEGRYLSEYHFECGPAADPRPLARIILVTESGRLRVDHVQIDDAGPSTP